MPFDRRRNTARFLATKGKLRVTHHPPEGTHGGRSANATQKENVFFLYG